LFDDRGNAMSPSYATKRNGQRYHYYVSQARLQNDRARAGTVARVPAKEIERLVQEAVGTSYNGGSGSASELLRRVERVVVHADRIEIVQAVTDGMAGDDEGESRTIVVRAKLAHRNRAVVLDDGRTAPDPVLLKAVCRAYEWRTWLEQGATLSYREIASKAGVTPGYVQKVLPLAFLAPGLTRELLDGRRRLHGGLMARLNRGIPADWDQQLTSF
jgi:site-specific DNA recombinase